MTTTQQSEYDFTLGQLDVDEEYVPTREEVLTARGVDSEAHNIAAIYRMWGWFKQWGHEPPSLDGLDDLPLGELRAVVKREAVRVRVLAESWDAWW